ncbi:MAG: hypothetical protein ACYDBB_08295 [Armatimonadota bacterium]
MFLRSRSIRRCTVTLLLGTFLALARVIHAQGAPADSTAVPTGNTTVASTPLGPTRKDSSSDALATPVSRLQSVAQNKNLQQQLQSLSSRVNGRARQTPVSRPVAAAGHPNGHSALSTDEREIVEHFSGTGQVGSFNLTNRPVMPRSEVITVEGMEQARGSAYTLDELTGTVQFTKEHLPPYGAPIVVRYQLALPTAAEAGRIISSAVNPTGPNSTTPAPTRQMVVSAPSLPPVSANTPANTAASTPDSANATTSAPASANAAASAPVSADAITSAPVSVNTGPVSATAQFLPGTENTVASAASAAFIPGGVQWSTSYSPSDIVTLTASGSGNNLSTGAAGLAGQNRSTGLTDQSGAVQQTNTLAVNVHPQNLPAVNYQHTTQTSAQGTGSGSSTTDQLSSSWAKNGLTASVNLDRTTSTSQQSQGLVSGLPNAVTSLVNTFTTQNTGLNLGYEFTDRLNAGVNLSQNQTQSNSAGQQTTGNGKTMQAFVNYRPKDNLTLTANMQSSTNEYGAGLPGSSSPTQQNQNRSMGVNWQPSSKVSVGVNYNINQTQSKTDAVAGLNPVDTQSKTANTTVNVDYHPSDRLNVGVNLTKTTNTASGEGAAPTGSGQVLQANATYRPAKNLSITGSLNSTTTGAVQIPGNGTTPALATNNASVQAEWQAKQDITVRARYRTDQAQNGATLNYNNLTNTPDATTTPNTPGSNGTSVATSTTAAEVSWRAGQPTSLTAKAAHQTSKDPSQSGASNLIGVQGQFTPLKNVTASAGLQRLWGNTSNSVNQLLQTEGQAGQTISPMMASPGVGAVTGTNLTAISGNVSYRAGDAHDLTIGGGVVQSSGPDAQRQLSLGVGWHYRANEDLTFSLDANKVINSGPGSMSVGGNSDNVNASMTVKF